MKSKHNKTCNSVTAPLHLLGRLVLLGMFLAACSSPSPTASPPTPVPVGLAGLVSGRVDVGGYSLYYQCLGQGSPTVILEAGGPGTSKDWELVMTYFGEITRICAYDRANLGRSDEAPKPRTLQDMNRDLHALLVNAPIEGPYILAGHSMGGMLVRLYASQYPDDVVGLVLVDSAHPEMGPRLLANLPPKAFSESKALKGWRMYGTYLSSSDGRNPNDAEGVDMQVSLPQVQAVASLGDLPLVVISRSPNNPVLAQHMPPLPDELNARLLQMWQDLQDELAGLSTNSTRLVADHSGHNVNYEEPGLVVEAIHKLVDEYRSYAGGTITATKGAVPAPSGGQAPAGNHPPVILRVVDRQEIKDGLQFYYKDIYFTDPDGDAITVVNKLISSSTTLPIYDDIIYASPEQQKSEALFTAIAGCGMQFDVVIEDRILDKAGNLSEPVTIIFSCPAPEKRLSPWLAAGALAVLGLLVAGGLLLLRRRRHLAQARTFA